jgi:molecular chaperone DnaK (HSP70)
MSEKKTEEMWIGADLGTSNSCVSVYQVSTQTLLIPTTNGSVLLPSLVHYSPTGDVLIGVGAQIAAVKYPERTIFAAKRMLGRKFSDPVIQDGLKTWPFVVVQGPDGFPLIEVEINGEKVYKSAMDVQTELLRYIRVSLAQQVLYWDECVNIVITVPAYFNHNQRHCTIMAAYQAGFKKVHIINEPSAAAFYFGYKESALAERLVSNILVFDLGGGTLDVSLIDVKDKTYRVLATDGDTQFGGFDIDKFIVDWLILEIKTNFLFDIYFPDGTNAANPSDMSANLSKLSTIAEKLKKSLSSLPSVTESSISLRGVPEGNKGFEDGFEVTIDRNVLNKYFTGNKHGRAATLRAIQRCVKKANLTLSDIHKVILVGGSTRIPCIPKMIQQFFKNESIIAKTVNADEAVSLGACLHAATLSDSPLQELKKPIELYDIAPLSYSIIVNNFEDHHSSNKPHQNTAPIFLTNFDHNSNNNLPNQILSQKQIFQFIPRNSCLIRGEDIIHKETINVRPVIGLDGKATVKFQLLESDDLFDLFPDSSDDGNSANPKSPGVDIVPELIDEVLHTVDVNLINYDAVKGDNVQFEVSVKLTSDYTISFSIKHLSTSQGFDDKVITPFIHHTSFDLILPQPTQPPKATTALGDSSDGLIKGRPAPYWDKKNWVEVEDSNGLYYKNKITGDTTFYEDDFDLESQ